VSVVVTEDQGTGGPLHVTFRVDAIGSTDAADQAKAEARAGGMKIRTLGWIKLVEGQTYENAFRERLSWDVLLVVRPAG
jgi:hypothetical protein